VGRHRGDRDPRRAAGCYPGVRPEPLGGASELLQALPGGRTPAIPPGPAVGPTAAFRPIATSADAVCYNCGKVARKTRLGWKAAVKKSVRIQTNGSASLAKRATSLLCPYKWPDSPYGVRFCPQPVEADTGPLEANRGALPLVIAAPDSQQTKRLLKQARKQAKAGKMSRGGRRSTSFRPGQSGNPTGRPKRPATIEARRICADVADAAREFTVDAINTLAAIMNDPKTPAAARISAAQAILDRGHGRPPQGIEVSTQPDLTHLSDEDLETLERILRPPDFPPPLLTG